MGPSAPGFRSPIHRADVNQNWMSDLSLLGLINVMLINFMFIVLLKVSFNESSSNTPKNQIGFPPNGPTGQTLDLLLDRPTIVLFALKHSSHSNFGTGLTVVKGTASPDFNQLSA